MSKLSVVIPVLNEAGQLNQFFKNLKVFKDENVEIIFVDGGSEDNTASLIEDAGFNLIRAPKGRGNQLSKGAENAKGDYLLFLHADSYFKQSPVDSISAILNDHQIGAFRLKFQPTSLILDFIAWGSNWRVKHRKIAFGDQGIFMHKSFYYEMGGIDNIALMEDYAWSLKVKNAGYSYQLASHPIYTSSRRFKQKGTVFTLIKMQYCQWLFRRGTPLDKIIDIYYN